jgi:AP endonuclease-2
MDYETAIPGHYDAFFSFPINKGGYSGVGVYTNSQTALPLKAEEGITGTLPKTPLSHDERISPTYPLARELNLMVDEDGNTPSDLAFLDYEGRGLILDYGLFVIFTLYCPNESSDVRHPYKMNFHYTLQERVRRLVEEDHRKVIVLGDINICSTPFDHAEGHLERVQTGFYEQSARKWLKEWLDSEKGCMTDIVWKFWPDRK